MSEPRGSRWPALMPASEAAEYVGMCRTTFDRKVKAGEIGFVQPNQPGWRMFRRTDLDAFVANLPLRFAETRTD